MVVPEHVSVHVPAEPLVGHRVIDAAYPVLGKRPEAFDGLGMYVSAYVDSRRVVDGAVVVDASERLVRAVVVRIQRRAAFDVIGHAGANLPSPTMGNDLSVHPASTLDRAENDGLAINVLLAGKLRIGARLAANERLVGLYLALQRFVGVLVHELIANQIRHAPRGLVRDAELPFKLLRGYSAPSARHQVHRVEPKVQRGRRLLKDRSGKRMKMLATSCTRPRRAPILDRVFLERSGFFTLRAERVLTVRREAFTPEELETGGVIGELDHELHERHARFR